MLREDILTCFESIGIIPYNDIENFLLKDFIEDSITFISLIVELEQKFEIEIPDEYLIFDALKTFDDVVNMIECIITLESKKNDNDYNDNNDNDCKE